MDITATDTILAAVVDGCPNVAPGHYRQGRWFAVGNRRLLASRKRDLCRPRAPCVQEVVIFCSSHWEQRTIPHITILLPAMSASYTFQWYVRPYEVNPPFSALHYLPLLTLQA